MVLYWWHVQWLHYCWHCIVSRLIRNFPFLVSRYNQNCSCKAGYLCHFQLIWRKFASQSHIISYHPHHTSQNLIWKYIISVTIWAISRWYWIGVRKFVQYNDGIVLMTNCRLHFVLPLNWWHKTVLKKIALFFYVWPSHPIEHPWIRRGVVKLRRMPIFEEGSRTQKKMQSSNSGWHWGE